MKQIRRQLTKLSHKLARVALGISVAEHRRKVQFRKEARAHASALRLRAARQYVRADRAVGRELYHRHKGQAWTNRKAWFENKHAFLQTLRHKNLRKKRAWLKAHPAPAPAPGGNLPTLDGKQLPRWIYDICVAARKSGRWHGYVISGYRSPAFSESLCVSLCGRSSCPGICAGRSSNHAAPPSGTGVPYEGAIDATDAGNLRAASGGKLNNHLPSDYPHSSYGGY